MAFSHNILISLVRKLRLGHDDAGVGAASEFAARFECFAASQPKPCLLIVIQIGRCNCWAVCGLIFRREIDKRQRRRIRIARLPDSADPHRLFCYSAVAI